jgi:Flp pilus assembly protein CpaB
VTSQRALLALAAAAGLVAGILYYAGAQRVDVVVAAVDLAAGHAITQGEVEIRSLPPDALPIGAVTDVGSAVGRFARSPIVKGQLLMASSLAASAAAFDTGVALPTGYRAVAIPVAAAHALGGAVIPGSRVDVIAVPLPGRAPSGRTTELIAAAALVVDVRGEMGGAFERERAASARSTSVRDRIGSVVVAVGPAAEMWIADRIATSTFVLALVHDRP